jgi:hypothetical protein
MAILVFSNETDGIHLSSGRLGVILQGRLVSIPRTEVTVTEASADEQRLVSLLRTKVMVTDKQRVVSICRTEVIVMEASRDK